MPNKEEIFSKHCSEVDNWNNALFEKDALIALDEYAKQVSIAFAEWVREHYYFDQEKKLFHPSNFGKVYESEFKTMEQLYDEFLLQSIKQ